MTGSEIWARSGTASEIFKRVQGCNHCQDPESRQSFDSWSLWRRRCWLECSYDWSSHPLGVLCNESQSVAKVLPFKGRGTRNGDLKLDSKLRVQNCVSARLVIPARLERATLSLEGRCSIQLSYGTNFGIEIKVAKAEEVVKAFSRSSAVKKSRTKLRIELRTR